MDTIKAREARIQQVTPLQKELIFGSLLGDGHLARTTSGYAFRVNHSFSQKEYVDWKYAFLLSLTNSAPRVYQQSYYFRTVTHPIMTDLRRMFYEGNQKRLPHETETLITPFAFAIWLMDDGARDKNQLRLNTQSFSFEENVRLIHILEAKLGITATINRDKDRHRLRVCATSMPRVRQLVASFIIPSMQYKLSL